MSALSWVSIYFASLLCVYLGEEVLGQPQARCAAPADAAEPFSTGDVRAPRSSCSHPCQRLILAMLVGEGIMFILKD